MAAKGLGIVLLPRGKSHLPDIFQLLLSDSSPLVSFLLINDYLFLIWYLTFFFFF